MNLRTGQQQQISLPGQGRQLCCSLFDRDFLYWVEDERLELYEWATLAVRRKFQFPFTVQDATVS